jgi:O-antigen/teichoic acid export membrane protein
VDRPRDTDAGGRIGVNGRSGVERRAGSNLRARVAANPATSGALMLGATIGAAALLSFVFHAIAGRMLDQQDYSSLGALLVLLVACAVPLGAVQVAVTAQTTRQLAEHGRVCGRAVLRRSTLGSLGATALAAAASPALAHLLRVDRLAPVAIAACWLAGNAPASVARGLLIGAGRLTAVAGSIGATALTRVALLVVLAPRFGLGGAVAAAALGECAGMFVAWAACRRAGLLHAGAPVITAPLADAGRALRTQLVLWLFAAAAPILARRGLETSQLGAFAAMATASSACLFLPQAIATTALPRFVRVGSRRQLRDTLLAAGAVSLVTALPLCVAPQLTFGMLFGDGYRVDRAVLVLLCVHMAGLGLLGTLAQFAVARRRGGAAVMLSGLLVAAGVSEVAAVSPIGLAGLLAAVTVPVVATTVYQACGWAERSPAAADTSMPRRRTATLARTGPAANAAAPAAPFPAGSA